MISILRGKRPKKPIFDTTRGYTEELWEMTTSCWKQGPTDRPTVDSVLAALKNAAGQWEPENGEIGTPSPTDDRSSTPLTERPNSPISEHENDLTTTASAPPNYPQPPVIETPVSDLPPTHSVPPSSAASDDAPPIPTLLTSPKNGATEPTSYTTSKEEPELAPATPMEETKPVPDSPSMGERKPKLTLTASGEDTNSVLISQSGKEVIPTPVNLSEELKSARTTSKGETKPIPAGPPKYEERKSTTATPKDVKRAPANPSEEELVSTRATSKEVNSTPVDRSREGPGLIPTISKGKSTVTAPKEMRPEHVDPRKGEEPKPTPATSKVDIKPALSSPPRGGEGPKQTTATSEKEKPRIRCHSDPAGRENQPRVPPVCESRSLRPIEEHAE